MLRPPAARWGGLGSLVAGGCLVLGRAALTVALGFAIVSARKGFLTIFYAVAFGVEVVAPF